MARSALAKALVYARTGDEAYRQQVIAACMAAIGTEQGGITLALGRGLLAYVLAADLAGLPPGEDAIFRAWLRNILAENFAGQTLRSSHETRPNNWGTHCGAMRAAVARYLGEATELERTARVFISGFPISSIIFTEPVFRRPFRRAREKMLDGRIGFMAPRML